MITLNSVTMGFSQRTLFKDVNLSIFKNEKIGLTGPNGAGKTTLFHIIRGDMEPVAGSVQIQKNINIGYLPQEAKFDSKRTVIEELTEGDNRIKALMDEKRNLEDANKADTDRYGDILHELETAGIYDIEHKAEKILMGLGFKPSDFNKPIVELSGGWQMRTLLAKLLVYPYDIILLDEPTNYLDLNATLWLKDYLANYPNAFVLISHDRVFLNDVTNYTIILERSQMTKVKGNYETYEMQKDINNVTLERQKKETDKKRKQLEDFASRFHAQPNKAASVRNKRKMLERLEEIEIPDEQRSIKGFEFANIPQSGYVVCQGIKLTKSYGPKQVYKDLDFEITKGQKICLVGPNGAGKSTLLKMLAGAIEPDSGQVKYGHQVQMGYFSQSRTDVLQMDRTAFDEVVSCAPQGVQAVRVRTLLGLFNYHGDDVFKPVRVLSGGEKSRLILAKLLINPPNFMLLDEPTTHLDIDGVKALTTAFKEYTGTLCFISHDLFFIKEIADHIVDVNEGQIRIYPGGLDYYLGKKEERDSADREQKKLEKEHQRQQDRKQKEREANSDENVRIREMREQHEKAKKRLSEIRHLIKSLQDEAKEIETESYVKARALEKPFDRRDSGTLAEYGKRLKEIQTRQREIESTIKKLEEERDRISK